MRENTKGKIIIVSLGPGAAEHLTPRASAALRQADIIIGYKTYINQVRAFLSHDEMLGKEIIGSGMRHEIERARAAFDQAERGKSVAIVSSGDAGIYGMAGLIYEIGQARDRSGVDVEVVPGISALNAAAALLGAPLMHDFAVVSLSDLLIPWEKIARRVELAAQADLVIVIYNPRSSQRVEQLAKARELIAHHRSAQTPVGIVRNAYREGQRIVVTDLKHLNEHEQEIDMLTTIVIGNSSTVFLGGRMVTPRGYGSKYELSAAGES